MLIILCAALSLQFAFYFHLLPGRNLPYQTKKKSEIQRAPGLVFIPNTNSVIGGLTMVNTISGVETDGMTWLKSICDLEPAIR
jgi:hypothetical protein